MEKREDIDEITLKDVIYMMVRKRLGVVNGIVLNVMVKYNIKGYQEEDNEDRKKEDIKLVERVL